MIRHPPRFTLFPYPPLFRSRRPADSAAPWPTAPSSPASPLRTSASTASNAPAARKSRLKSSRSEEHTSELQSPDHLVCRLLLEKKKINKQHRRTAAR